MRVSRFIGRSGYKGRLCSRVFVGYFGNTKIYINAFLIVGFFS